MAAAIVAAAIVAAAIAAVAITVNIDVCYCLLCLLCSLFYVYYAHLYFYLCLHRHCNCCFKAFVYVFMRICHEKKFTYFGYTVF